MNIEEIFTKLLEHMAQGIAFHKQAMEYFNFLTLSGYQECQKYHYYEEIKNCRELYDYYIDNYRRIIKCAPTPISELINASMYKYTREEIDANNKRIAIRNIYKTWVTWETETKQLLENCYNEIVDPAAALKILELLKEVEKELKDATNKYIQLEMVDYDIIFIEEEQAALLKKYKKKVADLKM